jgi:hypothetical protein
MSNKKPCPNCGYCPTCGRSDTLPFYPRPWVMPPAYPWGGIDLQPWTVSPPVIYKYDGPGPHVTITTAGSTDVQTD